MDSSIKREARDSHFTLASLPARHPLAQGVALALALGAGTTQAAVFNITTNTDSGPGSLRQAVLDANASSGADQITFNKGLGTIALTSGQISITETLTITGPVAGQTIDAGGNSRILGVTVADQPLTLENLTLTGGRTVVSGGYRAATCNDDTGDGGGICALGNFTLAGSSVLGNSTSGDSALGGGLFVSDGKANLIDSTVSGNSTTGSFAFGGGMSVLEGDTTLINSTVSGNSTSGERAFGGGLRIKGNATLTDSSVSANNTGGEYAGGGGLYVSGNATLTNSIVSGNYTTGYRADGGAVFVRSGDMTLTNCTVSANSTAGEYATGGGLSLVAGDVTLTNSDISGNSTAGDDSRGGGVEILSGNATLTNSTVSGNSTAGNSAGGGGLAVLGSATLTDSTISGNTTVGNNAVGGGFFVLFGNATLTNSTVSGNRTTGSAAMGAGSGGLLVLYGNAMLTNSTVTANQSAVGAGGVQSVTSSYYENAYNVTLANTVLTANTGPDGNFSAKVNSGSLTLDASNSLFGDAPSEINGINSENVISGDPGVAPLADNGCAMPAGVPGSAACVNTHALLTGSAAIDAADDTVCAAKPVDGLDQRGKLRPADGDDNGNASCDIGAFERQAATTPIDYDITGSWYNPATDGQGFSVEVLPEGDVVAVYWFTYNLDGSAQMWLQGAGAIAADVAQVPLQRLTGGQFVDPTPPVRSDWGTVTVRFFSDSRGEAMYDSPVDGVNGVVPMLRGTPAIACSEMSAPPPETIDARYTGSWYDPENDGQGLSLEVIPDANVLVVYWFTYTVDGLAQMWLQGAGPITGETATVELARPIGGQFDEYGVPIRPVWGTMTIGFDSDTSGEVSYDSPLDDVSGTFPIQRITPQAFCE